MSFLEEVLKPRKTFESFGIHPSVNDGISIEVDPSISTQEVSVSKLTVPSTEMYSLESLAKVVASCESLFNEDSQYALNSTAAE